MSTLEKDKDTILEYTLLLIQGKISMEQKEILDLLMDKNMENRKFFEETFDSWVATSTLQHDKVPVNSDDSWTRISRSINSKADLEQNKPGKKSGMIIRLVKTAALWLFLVSLGAFVSWFVLHKQMSDSWMNVSEIITPLGSRSVIRLPDGSKVWLNAGSKLQYSQNSFRNNREVYLEGEAYFDVTKMKRKIFIVNTSDINVKVYGTQFNVRSYPDENEIQTTLVKGAVSIEEKAKNAGKKAVFLKPNQMATFYKSDERKTNNEAEIRTYNKIEKQKIKNNIRIEPEIDPVTKTSWKDQQWIIMAENFGHLAIEMERRYNVNISFMDESLKDFKFSGKLTDETFEQVMKIIQLSAPVRFNYSIENNNVVLKYDEDHSYPNN